MSEVDVRPYAIRWHEAANKETSKNKVTITVGVIKHDIARVEKPITTTVTKKHMWNDMKRMQNTVAAFRDLKQRQKHDLVKLVKEFYITPDHDPYSSSHVKSRTTQDYNSEATETTWEDKYASRLNNVRTGHFSVNYQPYRTLGNVVLEPGELLIKTLENALPSVFLDEYYSAAPGDTSHLNKYIEKDKDKKRSEPEISISDVIQRLKCNRSAGMADIKRLLKETENRITACRAGQIYSSHLKQCQERKELEKKRRQLQEAAGDVMVLRKLSSTTLAGRAPLQEVDDLEDDIDNKMATPDRIFKRKHALATGEKFLDVRHKNEQISETRKANKKYMALYTRLKTITDIVYIMYNLRGKHLKSKTPLSAEVLNSLKRDPLAYTMDSLHRKARRATEMSYDMLTSRYEVPGTGSHDTSGKSLFTINSSNATPTGPQSYMSTSTQRSQEKPPRIMPRPSIGGKLPSRRYSRKTTRTILPVNEKQEWAHLETWEDLVHHNTGANKLLKHYRKVPPWQRHLSNDEPIVNTKKAKPQQNQSKGDSDDDSDDEEQRYHTEQTVYRLKLGSLHTKEKQQRNTTSELEKLEKERTVKSRYKLSAFDDMHPLYEVHRSQLKQVDSEATRDPTFIKEERAEWYDTLVTEAKHAGFSKDPNIAEKLTELGKFVHNDPKSIPQFKEKLCLLIISVPAYEVCTISMQRCITFVLEKILNCSNDLLHMCLEHRSLHPA